MVQRTTVLPWVAAAVVGVAVVILLILLYTEVIMGTEEAAPAPAVAQEFVSGVKREPGTWQEETIRVTAGDLRQPDVTFDVDVFSFGFDPSTIEVKQGQVVKLVLHGLDDGQLPELTGAREFSGHGFHLKGPYDVWITGIRKDATKEVVFEANYPGEWEFECVVLCGVNHPLMKGKLIVEEAQ